MTPTEEFVFRLCRDSFLSLWSYPNPRRTDGRELCDALVVCGQRVILFSVKEIALSETATPKVAAERWSRKAIHASIAQLHGAEKELGRMTYVIGHDGARGIDLPEVTTRKVHRIAVAVGAHRSVSFESVLDSSKYMHVIDEVTAFELLRELDTIVDFAHYLDAKEAFAGVFVCESEEDLLGLYLQRGRSFPSQAVVVVEPGAWAEVCAKPEFIARKHDDTVSYFWDHLIELFIADYGLGPGPSPSPNEYELLVRTMAMENRFARRIIAAPFAEWFERKTVGARSLVSPSGVAYVFATYPRARLRDDRREELLARCLVMRSPVKSDSRLPNVSTVVGIATEIRNSDGFSLDAIYLNMPEWSDDDEAIAQEARDRFGIMKRAVHRKAKVQEFPMTAKSRLSRTEKNRKKRERRSRR